MKEPSKSHKMKFYPEPDVERNLPFGGKFKKKKYKPRVINKKRNPHSFVVDWQLSDDQDE